MTAAVHTIRHRDPEHKDPVWEHPGVQVQTHAPKHEPNKILEKLPSLEIQKTFHWVKQAKRIIPEGKSPFGVLVKDFKVSFKGTVTYGESDRKVAVGGHEVEFGEKFEGPGGEFEVKSAFDWKEGKWTPLSVEWTSKKFPIVLSLTPAFSLDEPVTVGVKSPDFKVAAWKVRNVTFTGNIQVEFSIILNVDFKWPGWSRIGQAAVQAGRTVVHSARAGAQAIANGARIGAQAARQAGTAAAENVLAGIEYITVAGEVGQASILGIVGTAAAFGAASIAWVAFGLYKMGENIKDGRRQAAAFAFARGYAKALSLLTEEDPTQVGDALKIPRDFDWKAVFETSADLYGSGKAGVEAIAAAEKAGKVAVITDATNINHTGKDGRANWARIAEQHRKQYGASPDARKAAYLNLLNHQVETRQAILGLRLI